MADNENNNWFENQTNGSGFNYENLINHSGSNQSSGLFNEENIQAENSPSYGERQERAESGGHTENHMRGDSGTLVGSGAQELIEGSVARHMVGSDRQVYTHGENEGNWTDAFIKEQEGQGRNVYQDIYMMYHDKTMQDNAGFETERFRSFADGRAPVSSGNMMSQRQAEIVFRHREEIQNNGGVLDIAHLPKKEQETMAPAVVLSQWARNEKATGTGYLTDDSTSIGYQQAQDYVKSNHITEIKFTDRQMGVLNGHARDLRTYQMQMTNNANQWKQFETAFHAYQKKAFPNQTMTDAARDTVLSEMAKPKTTYKEALTVETKAWMNDHAVTDKAKIGKADWDFIRTNAKARVVSENQHFVQSANQNPVYQALSKLQEKRAEEGTTKVANTLTSHYSESSLRGMRIAARRHKFEETQNGENNFTGQELTDRRKKLSNARRTHDVTQSAKDAIRKSVATNNLNKFDQRETAKKDLQSDLSQKAKEIEKIKNKNVLSDDDRKKLKHLQRDSAKSERQIRKIDKKNRTEFLNEGKGSYREVLKKQKDNAEKIARTHREHHAAVRNRQFVDMANGKGIQSVHAEERILKRDKKSLRDQAKDARRANRRGDLRKKIDAGGSDAIKARKKLDRMDQKDVTRMNRANSRPSRAIGRAKGKLSGLRDKVEGRIGRVENFGLRFKHKLQNSWMGRHNPLSKLRNVKRKVEQKAMEKVILPLLKILVPILLPILIILLILQLVALLFLSIVTAIGGSDPTKNNAKNEDNLAPGYYQATVTALQDYQKSYLNYYSDAAKKAAEGQADSIASKYDGYLGANTVAVDTANIRSITNEYGEPSSDISDTLQALTMARVRFLGTTLGDENEMPKDTITNMALYMTALWVGDEGNGYVKGLAQQYGGTTGLNHQIVVNPKYNDANNTNAIHNSQGGITDSEGNQYSYIYTNYGELDDSTRPGCNNVWYKDGSGKVQRTPTNLTWNKNTYGDNGSGTSPKSIGVGNPKIVSATVTEEIEQTRTVYENHTETTTVSKQWRPGVLVVSPDTIQSEDNNNGDHFFRVNDNQYGAWSRLKSGDVFVLSDGSVHVALKVGLITHKNASKNYSSHYNFHYTEASSGDVVAQGKVKNARGKLAPCQLGQLFRLYDASTTTTKSVPKQEYTGTFQDGGSVTYQGSSIKYDAGSGTFLMADNSPIPMTNEAHKRSRVSVTWQDGGRDGGRLIPQMDIFYVQDIQNLIKSDNWKTGDALPESKSGGIFRKHQKQLEQVFGKGFNPGNDNKSYSLSFPNVAEDKNDKDTSDLSGSEFWNAEGYDVHSPWYSQDDRKNWLKSNQPNLTEQELTDQSDPNTFVAMACDIVGDRSTGYKDGTDFWDAFDVKIQQGSVNGSFSNSQITQLMGSISQADISGINAQLGGQIPPGVQAMNSYALSRVGQPYVWGGDTESYADCSGFVSCIWRHLGYIGPKDRYTTKSLFPMGQTWGENDRLPAGTVLVNHEHTVYVAGWNEQTQRYVVVEAMCDEYGIVVSDGTPGRRLRNTSQAALHKEFPSAITKYCMQ
ncbi:NlpC/P60 family protein [Lachnospiraceae bacterium YH-ros2228]